MTTKRRGICPVCNRTFYLTVAGQIRRHGIRGAWPPEDCEGVGEPPREESQAVGTEVEDDREVWLPTLAGPVFPMRLVTAKTWDAALADADDAGYRRAVQALRDAAKQRQDEGNSTLWATYSAGADFLDCRLAAAPRNEGAQT